jgi:hypothetical protein
MGSRNASDSRRFKSDEQKARSRGRESGKYKRSRDGLDPVVDAMGLTADFDREILAPRPLNQLRPTAIPFERRSVSFEVLQDVPPFTIA